MILCVIINEALSLQHKIYNTEQSIYTIVTVDLSKNTLRKCYTHKMFFDLPLET